MADDDEVEIVYVNTIHPTHHALAKMALEAGKHVLVEKPFTMNHREAADLAALAAEKGLFLMEAMCALPAFPRSLLPDDPCHCCLWSCRVTPALRPSCPSLPPPLTAWELAEAV